MAEPQPDLGPCAAAVDAAYDTRNRYFQLHPAGADEAAGSRSSGREREKCVAELQAGALALLQPLEEQCKRDSKYHFLVGKAWNVTPDYTKKAEDALAHAVKLDPDMLEGWLELGECFWKKKDHDSSKRCFERASKLQKNKRSLWALSMLLRMAPSPPQDRRKRVAESVGLAKEALALDMADGHSWFVLGNAFLASFFSNLRETSFMEQALKAYKRAMIDETECANNADLHHNRAMLLKYQENYAEALQGLATACRLDPRSKAAAEQAEALESTLSKIHNTIDRKGHLKGKRAAALIASLTLEKHPILVSLKDLEADAQRKGELDLKIAVNLTDDAVAQIFACLDRDGNWCCLTVYNLVVDAIKVGDTVTIGNPVFKIVTLPLSEKQISFSSIRVDEPTSLIVNGDQLDASSVSSGALSLEARPE